MIGRGWHRALAEAMGLEHALYWVFMHEPRHSGLVDGSSGVTEVTSDLAHVRGSPHEEVRVTAEYGGREAAGFCITLEQRAVAVAWYWWGKRYARRGFLHLAEGEAKLVHIVVAEEYRGRGLAHALLTQSASHMAARGFGRLFARVWHSNTGSVRAFTKAGWRKYSFVIGLTRRATGRSWCIKWPLRRYRS